MKKFLVSLLTVAMLLVFSVTAFAATIATPFNDTTLNVNVALKFDSSDIASGFAGVANAPFTTDELSTYADITDGKLVISEKTQAQAWIGLVANGIVGKNANAVGFGFYVKNTTGATCDFDFVLTTAEDGNLNNGAYTIGSNQPYVLVAANGTETTVNAPECKHPYDAEQTVHSYFSVPKGFQGYVVVPFTSTALFWGSDPLTDATALTGAGAGFSNNGTADFSNGSLIFDNVFFYGADVTPVDADLINLDDLTDTADFSVLAYAFAAVIGCGALAIRKRK